MTGVVTKNDVERALTYTIKLIPISFIALNILFFTTEKYTLLSFIGSLYMTSYGAASLCLTALFIKNKKYLLVTTVVLFVIVSTWFITIRAQGLFIDLKHDGQYIIQGHSITGYGIYYYFMHCLMASCATAISLLILFYHHQVSQFIKHKTFKG